MRQSIYIDTSVFGGYYDEEFEEATKQLFERINTKSFFVYFSEIIETELEFASNHIKETDCRRHIEIDDEVEALAKRYIKEKVFRKSSANDAYHIALASVNRLDLFD